MSLWILANNITACGTCKTTRSANDRMGLITLRCGLGAANAEEGAAIQLERLEFNLRRPRAWGMHERLRADTGCEKLAHLAPVRAIKEFAIAVDIAVQSRQFARSLAMRLNMQATSVKPKVLPVHWDRRGACDGRWIAAAGVLRREFQAESACQTNEAPLDQAASGCWL